MRSFILLYIYVIMEIKWILIFSFNFGIIQHAPKDKVAIQKGH